VIVNQNPPARRLEAARLLAMSSNARIITALGVCSFLIAGFSQLLEWISHSQGGFLAYMFDGFIDKVSIAFAAVGALLLLCALFVNRKDRKLQEFEEALKLANQPEGDGDLLPTSSSRSRS
jgi:hypothetical protein